MVFKDNKPIYRQIIDYCFNCIISGEWMAGQRVPSVREMAVELAVNSHTVLKAYEYLQTHAIISPKRGMGFFLEPNATEHVRETMKEEFYTETLTATFADMRTLGIDIEDVIKLWHQSLPESE